MEKWIVFAKKADFNQIGEFEVLYTAKPCA